MAGRRSIAWTRRLLPLLLGAWALAAGVLLALAAVDLRDAKATALAARDGADASALRDGSLRVELQRSEARFRRGAGRLRNPLLGPLRVLPFVGRQHRSAVDLADAAATLAGAGAEAAGQIGDALEPPPASGTERLEALRRVDLATSRARSVLDDVDLGPTEGLLGPLRDARADLQRQLVEAQRDVGRGATVTSGVSSFLGSGRRYVLLAANNAEMRAGSGMFLSIGILETDAGEIRLGEMRPAGDLLVPAPGVAVEGDLAELWGWAQPGVDWRNLALSPRFESSAPVAAALWKARTAEDVDGVLAVDVVALRALLAATGPVDVDGEQVAAAGVERRLFRDQYVGLTYGRGSDAAQDQRREELGDIAGAVVDAVEGGRIDLPTLADELATAAAGRHVLAWSRHPDEQRAWDAADISGKLAPSSLAVSVLNRAGNKLDPYLEVVADLAWADAGAARRRLDLTIRITNRTPEGEPEYVAGPHPAFALAPGTYQGLIGLNLPGAAERIEVDGAAVVVRGADGPTQALATELLLPRGATSELHVAFELPRSVARISVEPGARVPPSRFTSRSGSWVDDRRRTIELEPEPGGASTTQRG